MSLLGKDWRKPRPEPKPFISHDLCFAVQKFEGKVEKLDLYCPGFFEKDVMRDECSLCKYYRRKNDENIKTISRELRSNME